VDNCQSLDLISSKTECVLKVIGLIETTTDQSSQLLTRQHSDRWILSVSM